jgi:CHAT domain-containing protein/TPR repeat protein
MYWAAASFVILVFVPGCSPPRYTSADNAVLKGEIRDALTIFELQAKEAEENARISWWPRQYLATASWAYGEASKVALYGGQLQKAVTYGEKALEMAENIKEVVPKVNPPVGTDELPSIKVRAILQLIQAYRSVRDYQKATELIKRGLPIIKDVAEPAGYLALEGTFYFNLGAILIDQRQYGEAVDAFSASFYLQQGSTGRFAAKQTIPLRQRLAITTLIFLGKAYLEAEKSEEAMEQYQRAQSLIEEWRLRYPFAAELHEGIGEVFFRRGDLSQALAYFDKAMSLADGQQRSPVSSSASRRIGDILRVNGKAVEAISYYQKAIQQIESTRSFFQSEEYRQSYFGGAVDAYIGMMDAVLLAGKPEEAFNYSERARSRVFLDLLGSRVQLSRVRGGLLEEERALNEQIAGLKARLASEEEEASRESLRSELTRAERAYSIFLSKVRKEDKEQASLMTVEPLGLKQVQELLDPGTTLLEYFVTGKEVFAWVIEREKLQFQRVELPKEKLNGLVKTLRDSIFTLGEREKFNETSAVLYKQLIEPLLPHITGKELIIVPHDVLHYLPFHALVGSDGRYLIEKYPVYYLSSASLLQFVKEKRKASGEKVLAFGNPDLGDPEKNLEFAELEAEEVKNVYPQATVFVKKEASEEKSKSLSPTYDILHFATHAQLDEDDPLSSAVLLAREDKEDGRLEVREIFGMELKANLVVLSGCETGLGKLSTGDELVGLTRAFIYAGTPSVVASLWSVDDSSTAQLMASFYRNLKTMSKVEALRQAQLELIRGEGNTDMLARRGVGGIGKLGETVKSDASQNPMSISTSHPYFWAPFILVGDGK